MIHYKYAETLNVLFVAFTYGPSIPFLFVLAGTFFTLQLVFERFMIAFYYARPPLMHIRLTKSFLWLLNFP